MWRGGRGGGGGGKEGKRKGGGLLMCTNVRSSQLAGYSCRIAWSANIT